MVESHSVALIIPALNEEEAIGAVIAAVDRELVDAVFVVDNGSSDRTMSVASAAGATVLHQPRRGYGSACLTGIAAAGDVDILVFLDGDGSDDPAEIPVLLEVLVGEQVHMVIGSRVLGDADPGALTPVQRFGNTLTCALVALMWGVRYTDLGPFRAVRRQALELLSMEDPDYGWTIEMQVKAAQVGLLVREVPVTRRARQGGRSKVSGSIIGSYRAGKRILGYVFEAKGRELLRRMVG